MLLSAYLYPISLAIISVAVFAAERIWPWRQEQRAFRKAFGWDLMHLVFNGHFLGVIIWGIATYRLLPPIDAWLAERGWEAALYRGAASEGRVWVQIVVALLVLDFMQWCIHNLLHRVPALWEMHKCHHSVADGEMDWIVAFRFQWTEVADLQVLQYLPLAFLGFGGTAIMFHAIFGTLIGHLNHSNLKISWGPLRYVLNSPRMHIWHHDYDRDAKTTVNFGIIFSMWDWIFGTAEMPDEPPQRIGFEGDDTYPRQFFAAEAWPISGWVPGTAGRVLGTVATVGLLAVGWWLHLPPG